MLFLLPKEGLLAKAILSLLASPAIPVRGIGTYFLGIGLRSSIPKKEKKKSFKFWISRSSG